jgi:hypothetical protein
LCSTLPTQVAWLGAQKLHVLPMQEFEAQTTLVPQSPLELQVCWEVPPTQRVSPGVQAVQSFPRHTPGAHDRLLPQVPLMLQVC